jgi:hypothetical protein
MASVTELLSEWVERAASDFSGRNASVRGAGSVVHAVGLVHWIGVLEVPGPLCHVGLSGGELAALRPTTAPVTCRRCLRRLGVEDGPPGAEQLTLFDTDVA